MESAGRSSEPVPTDTAVGGPAPLAYSPETVPADTLKQVLKEVLRGTDLSNFSLGEARPQLAQRLDLAPDRLERRKKEIKKLAKAVVQEMLAEKLMGQSDPIGADRTPGDAPWSADDRLLLAYEDSDHQRVIWDQERPFVVASRGLQAPAPVAEDLPMHEGTVIMFNENIQFAAW